MARAKLVLDSTEKVKDLLALLKKMQEAGIDTVEIESPASIHCEPYYPYVYPYWSILPPVPLSPTVAPMPVWCTSSTATQLPNAACSAGSNDHPGGYVGYWRDLAATNLAAINS